MPINKPTPKSRGNQSDLDQQLADIHSYNVNIGTREIYLHGDHQSEDNVCYLVSVPFIKNLQFLDHINHKQITVHMHLDGGDWGAGMAMMDAMRFAKSSIKMLVYSQASSMSGILLQAADKRIMMPHSHFMMHHGSYGQDGTSKQVHSGIKWNEDNCKTMIQIFADRAISGKFAKEKDFDSRKLSIYFDKQLSKVEDWYLTAEETVYYGLADAIFRY